MNDILSILKDLRPEEDFENSKNFFEDGLLDSFDLVTLVTVLEEKYDIMIDPLDMVPENFESVETIIELVRKNDGKIG